MTNCMQATGSSVCKSRILCSC